MADNFLQQGAYGFKFVFGVDFEPLDDTRQIRVIIKRPGELTTLQRLKSEGDVVIINLAKKLIGVQIKQGDLAKKGTYQYQAIDETNNGSVRSEVGEIEVKGSLVV